MNSMIIEKLVVAGVLSSTGRVDKEQLATYSLTHDILVVMYDVTEDEEIHTYVRAVINKWTFQDKAMGEQFLTFTLNSEVPVAWAIGDYCVFRGEIFSLNYIPSVTQKAGRAERLDSYVYENVKINSLQDELTRCQMLDVVLGDHSASEGTNYTGSAVFELFCGETSVVIEGTTVVRTPVATLADKILANLNRRYGDDVWHIYVNYTTTHTEDKKLLFNNQYVSQALAEVKNTFDINYCVKGRNIYIGYDMADITGDTSSDIFKFGYGKGYPVHDADGKGLFEIKKISDSQQQIVTRLRVLGSSKNLPYRYYNKHYPNLPQTLFPLTLQLPDTFLPEGYPTDLPSANTKWGHNNGRPSTLNAVLGPENDGYIDKGNDAAGQPEGIREATVRFDGSDGKIKEIYPTIEDVTYDELRAATGLKDIDGTETPSQSAFPVYGTDEKINRILAIGYDADGEMVDDANIGNGILSVGRDDEAQGTKETAEIATQIYMNISSWNEEEDYLYGDEEELFHVNNVVSGRYAFTPYASKEPYYWYNTTIEGLAPKVGFIIRVKQTTNAGSVTSTIAEYVSDWYSSDAWVKLPSIPDALFLDSAKVKEIKVTETSKVTVTFTPIIEKLEGIRDCNFIYGVTNKGTHHEYIPKYVWCTMDEIDSGNVPFHIYIKDMGFNLTAQFNGDTPKICMKSGLCIGREFQIGENIEEVEYEGKKGYKLTLTRDQDTSLNTYYPNTNYVLAANDAFVITGIDMPDAYVQAAELRLLVAATEWMSKNGSTHFHYQPSIDDVFLKRNYDNMVAAGTPEKSIYWRLYAGLKLSFYGIPNTPNDTTPEESVTIDSVTINMGDNLTRKVEIVLNDEPKQSTLQKVAASVDKITSTLQAGGSGMSTVTMENTVMRIGDNRYISKVYNDTADNDITFNGTISFSKRPQMLVGALFSQDSNGLYGADIDESGNIHSRKNIYANGGVAAGGIPDLPIVGGGGGGTITEIDINGTPLGDEDGVVNIPLATTGNDGAMSAADKTKLNGIETGAEKNKIDAIKVNGVTQTPVNREVNITIPDVPDVVAYNDLDDSEEEDLTKVASAKSVAILKGDIGINDLDEFSTSKSYYRGDVCKVTDGMGVARGYRFEQNKAAGAWDGTKVVRLTYKTLAQPCHILESDLLSMLTMN